jgi:hypothetical protein
MPNVDASRAERAAMALRAFDGVWRLAAVAFRGRTRQGGMAPLIKDSGGTADRRDEDPGSAIRRRRRRDSIWSCWRLHHSAGHALAHLPTAGRPLAYPHPSRARRSRHEPTGTCTTNLGSIHLQMANHNWLT